MSKGGRVHCKQRRAVRAIAQATVGSALVIHRQCLPVYVMHFTSIPRSHSLVATRRWSNLLALGSLLLLHSRDARLALLSASGHLTLLLLLTHASKVGRGPTRR